MSDKQTAYTGSELLATVAARSLEDGCSVFVGTGLPMVATMLAQLTHAPNLLLIFEAGGIGPQMAALPVSVGDTRTYHRAVAASSMHDVMSAAQSGLLDYGFLGAAQIDHHGNINTTVIGPHDNPRARLPGSGGANDLGSFCWRTIVIMRQDRTRFVPQVDFVTTPGYLDGPGAREKAGLPAGGGPYRIITQLGVYDFEETTKRVRLVAVHPGVTAAQAQENSAFDLLVADPLGVTEPPTAEDLRILREVIDPTGTVLG
jgi:glutaconate CoA-transferase, subunit B